MKTVTLIISSLFLLMTLGANAQHQSSQRGGQKMQMNPEEMVKKTIEKMKIELKLNEKQEKQVKELLEASMKQRQDMMKKHQGQRDSMMFHSKKMEEQQNLSLKKILTADQFKTFQTNQEKRKQEMEKRRKEMMGKHQGGKMR